MTIRRIFHPTDLSGSSDVALRFALDVARQFDAELFVGHVIQEDTVDDSRMSGLQQKMRDAVAAGLSAWEPEQSDALQIYYDVRAHPSIGTGLVEFTRAKEIDLIIMGRHGAFPIRRLLLGSVAFAVLHAAQTNVVIVPETFAGLRAGGMLVPLDFRERSVHLLAAAGGLARRFNAPLDLLHVIDLPERSQFRPDVLESAAMSSLTEVAMGRLKAFVDEVDPEVSMSTHVRTGHPVGAILNYVNERDSSLLVLASSGMSPDERIRNYPMEREIYDELHWTVSRVTERLATYSPVPAWIIKRFPAPARRKTTDAFNDPSVANF